MSKNFARGLTLNGFQGASDLYSSGEGGLASLIRRLYQADARRRMVAINASNLTDSSGGTAPAQYKSAASAPLAEYDLTGLTTGVTAARIVPGSAPMTAAAGSGSVFSAFQRP